MDSIKAIISNLIPWLDDQTKALMESFPKADLWGPARKCINIFMVMASLNRFLCEAYGLERFEDVLEVPLDGEVGRQLSEFGRHRNVVDDGKCPKWTTIKALSPTDGDKYQKIAAAMAKELGIPRGRLDVELWRPIHEEVGPDVAASEGPAGA